MPWGSGPDQSSEGTAAVEEDEDHSGASKSDQRKGGEIGDQVDVDAHGSEALSDDDWQYRLRGLRACVLARGEPL